jgi:hypothetical protein
VAGVKSPGSTGRSPAGPRSEGLGGRIGLLLLVNALPIGTAVAVLVLRQRGEVTVKPLPAGSAGNVVLIGLLLVSIVALGWFVYPLLRNLRDAARRRTRGLFFPFWGALWLIAALDLLILGTLVLALFAAELVLLARFALSIH